MTSWSQKRPGAGKFTPEDVDASLCTHIVYAFATLKNHKLSEADDKDGEMYERVVALREKNPNLKVRLENQDYGRKKNKINIIFTGFTRYRRMGVWVDSVQRTYVQHI